MIKQLQRRFIRIAVVSLTVAMVLVVGIVNIANLISVRTELSDTLSLLAGSDSSGEREGREPEETSSPAEGEGRDETETDGPQVSRKEKGKGNSAADATFPPRPNAAPSRHFRNMMAETNWFSGIVGEDGGVKRVWMEQMENLDEETAVQMIQRAISEGKTEGFLQDYMFRVRELRSGDREIILMNCETRLATVRKLMWISGIACAGGILLAWLLVTLASRKAVEPTIRNMEQQKQFITNASHELKTPLTVIATNMELLEMETEDNPWVRSTQKQTAALRRLVDELVYLSRMEEEYPTLSMEPLDPGNLLEETAEPFTAMAEFNGKEMKVTAEKGLTMNGDRASIQRLMSTLCDNAVKYASAGPITAELKGEGKNIVLKVSNPVAEPLNRQQCEQLFNRFYRVDPSRNKDKKSGFGIGLAIAAAIAEKHGGRITASMEGDRLAFVCTLPKEA